MQRPGVGKSSETSEPREDGGRRDRREGPVTLVRMQKGLRNFFFWVIREAGGRRVLSKESNALVTLFKRPH